MNANTIKDCQKSTLCKFKHKWMAEIENLTLPFYSPVYNLIIQQTKYTEDNIPVWI